MSLEHQLTAAGVPVEHHATVEALVNAGWSLADILGLVQKYGPVVLEFLGPLARQFPSGQAVLTLLQDLLALIPKPPVPTP